MPLFIRQDGATGSRNSQTEEGDGGPPVREQTASSGGDSGNDGPSTNNSSVSDVTEWSGVAVGQLTVEIDHETETKRKAHFKNIFSKEFSFPLFIFSSSLIVISSLIFKNR